MLMSRYTQGMQSVPPVMNKKGQKVLLGVCAALLIIAVALGAVVAHTAVFRHNTDKQLSQRMINCVSDAIAEVNRMSGVVSSGTATRLGVVRQYVYTMDQLNQISISLHGNSGRLAPQEAFTALYSDIENFERLTQTATSSTLDARTLLLTHLNNLQMLLTESGK